jgi:hypothetical protein
MIDHLKAISSSAGRDIAAELAHRSTIQVMAVQVRTGVRRRRIRIGAVALSLALVVGISVIALPTLLRGRPLEQIEPAHSVVRTEGPVTTFDDGAMSVVLSSGAFVELPPYGGDTVFGGVSRPTMCSWQSPTDLPVQGWQAVSQETNRLVRLATVAVVDSTGNLSSVLPGQTLPPRSDGTEPAIAVAVQTDPAIAPYVVLRVTVVQFHVGEDDLGGPIYQNTFSRSALYSEPTVTYAGDANLGTRVGTVTSEPFSMDEWGACYMYPPTEEFWEGPFEWHVIADVFLVDRAGGQTTLGTYVSWFEADVKHTGIL